VATIFPPRVGTVFAERYQLRELLGGGGVGQVFRAWDLQAQRLVALKVFNPARVSVATWKAYAQVVNAALPVRHPDVILPQAGVPEELPDAPAVVLEALVGEDLATLRARQGRVPWARALEIGARCAVVLEALYARTGVAHRDLKASNVFIDQSGSVKLLDYGVAEFDVQSAESTRVDAALGMVDYKAPEQLETNIGGHQSDMFSLAVLVYEMIAGVRPFAGPSYFEVARKILLEPAPRIGEVMPEARVPVGVDVFLHRAFEKRPDDRYSDLAAMHRAFVEVLRGAPRATVIGTTREAVLKAAAEAEELPTVLVGGRPAGRKGGSMLQQGPAPVATPRAVTAGRQVVPSGARAVVVAGHEPDAASTLNDRTVVSMGAMPPAADRTMILADPRLTADDDDDEPRTTLQGRAGGRGLPPAADRTMILRDDQVSGAPPAERTMILRDDQVSGAPAADRTMILRDDQVSGAPAADRTMILRDDQVSGAPRAEATLMLQDEGVQAAAPRRAGGTQRLRDDDGERAEGTMQLPGERAPARGWTLQRTLILVNVTCGVLILLGLLWLVLSGGEAGSSPGK
jgi:hypothetical protein